MGEAATLVVRSVPSHSSQRSAPRSCMVVTSGEEQTYTYRSLVTFEASNMPGERSEHRLCKTSVSRLFPVVTEPASSTEQAPDHAKPRQSYSVILVTDVIYRQWIFSKSFFVLVRPLIHVPASSSAKSLASVSWRKLGSPYQGRSGLDQLRLSKRRICAKD